MLINIGLLPELVNDMVEDRNIPTVCLVLYCVICLAWGQL